MTQKYKVVTKWLADYPKGTILQQYKDTNIYSIGNEVGGVPKDLVENNPGFFQKIEFTEENIIKLRHKLNNLDARFHAFGTSEGFIKEFKEFEKIVKNIGEYLNEN